MSRIRLRIIKKSKTGGGRGEREWKCAIMSPSFINRTWQLD